MTLEQKNMECLSQRYPGLYEKLTKMPISDKYAVVNINNSGKINVLNKQNNRLIYDRLDPYGKVLDGLVNRNIKIGNLAVFLGLGLLYNVKAYVDTYINNKVEDYGLILIEKDIELFQCILKSVDITSLLSHPKCFLFVDKSPSEMHMNFSTIFRETGVKLFIKATNFIEEPAVFSESKDYYISVIKAYKEASKDVLVHFGNCPNDSLIGIDHTLLNIDEIIYHPGIQDLKGAFKGKPGIVVSTGPSLNKNVHLLEGLENKAVICCPDASVLVLNKHGKKPHLVTSLERVEATSKLFDGLTEEDVKDVYFAATPVVHPLTYQNWPGKKICVYRNFSTFMWLDIEKGILDIGPSAGNMAFEVLAYLGCDPIILIGQDLAFAEDGMTHAKGSRYGEKDERDMFKRTFTVPGNIQPEVKTIAVWENFRRTYNLSVARTSAKVINATEGGARIEGTEIMTFQEAIDKYISGEMNVPQMIEERLNYPSEKEIAENLEKVKVKVDDAINYVTDIASKFLDAAKETDYYFENIWKKYDETGEYDFDESKRVLQEVNEAIMLCNSRDFFLIVMHYVQSYYIKSMINIYGVRANSENLKQEHHDVLKVGRDLLYVLHALVVRMLPMFNNLKAYLESKES
jgi:hypothetical protein